MRQVSNQASKFQLFIFTAGQRGISLITTDQEGEGTSSSTACHLQTSFMLQCNRLYYSSPWTSEPLPTLKEWSRVHTVDELASANLLARCCTLISSESEFLNFSSISMPSNSSLNIT